MTSREFSALCKRYGFSQQGKVYYRCFGEGILQLITIGNQEYLDPLSPERTDKHRKSNRISFYFWSMYENLPETFFFDTQYFTGIYPEQLFDRECWTAFMGLQSQYDLMDSYGFHYLDSIGTQKDLLCAIIDYETIERHTPCYMNSYLVAPFLLCHESKEALLRLACLHVQNYSAFRENNRDLRETKMYDEYFEKLDMLQGRMAYRDCLIWDIVLERWDSIKEKLHQNFLRNCEWANKYKFAFSDNFSPIDLQNFSF